MPKPTRFHITAESREDFEYYLRGPELFSAASEFAGYLRKIDKYFTTAKEMKMHHGTIQKIRREFYEIFGAVPLDLL